MQSDIARPLFQPPAPKPLAEPLGLVSYLRQLRANPLTTWTQEHFEKPIVAAESVLGRITVARTTCSGVSWRRRSATAS